MFPSVNWTSGGPITFGFHDAVATSEIDFTLVGGYDNFTVVVGFTPLPPTPVPSLSTLSLGLLLGLIVLTALAVGRRRRTAS